RGATASTRAFASRCRRDMRALLFVVVVAACHRDDEAKPVPAPAPEPAIVPAKQPIRTTGDREVRTLLADVASARACELIKGQFRALRAADHPALATGVLWIRDCRITNTGTQVDLHLAGVGWQWAHQGKHEAGGSFE